MKRGVLRLADCEIAICGWPDDLYFSDIQAHAADQEFYAKVLRDRIPEDATIIDVGANIGVTAALAAKLLPRASIIAIEPVPRTFECLKATIAANGLANVRPLNLAIGRSLFGTAHFRQMDSLACSHRIDGPTHYSVPVHIRRLDYVVRRLGLRRVDLVKIDVEGRELEVLHGMRFMHGMTPLVFAEFNPLALTAFGNVSPRSLLDYVRDRYCELETADGKKISDSLSSYAFLYETMTGKGTDDFLFRMSGVRQSDAPS